MIPSSSQGKRSKRPFTDDEQGDKREVKKTSKRGQKGWTSKKKRGKNLSISGGKSKGKKSKSKPGGEDLQKVRPND